MCLTLWEARAVVDVDAEVVVKTEHLKRKVRNTAVKPDVSKVFRNFPAFLARSLPYTHLAYIVLTVRFVYRQTP